MQSSLPDYSRLLQLSFWAQHPIFSGKRAST
jgi:hypothetical protein